MDTGLMIPIIWMTLISGPCHIHLEIFGRVPRPDSFKLSDAFRIIINIQHFEGQESMGRCIQDWLDRDTRHQYESPGRCFCWMMKSIMGQDNPAIKSDLVY
jgi:hypothetical protein